MTTPAETTAPKKSNTMLYAGILIVIIIIAGAAAFFLFNQPFTPTRTIRLNGNTLSGWNSTNPGPAITINLSDKVRLVLTSIDSQVHNFFIDYNSNGLPEAGETQSSDFASSTSSINFDFTPTQAGTFTYYCKYHTNTMRGTITIQNA